MKAKNRKMPSLESVFYSLESFALDASEKELDESIESSGVKPDEILAKANSAIENAFEAIRAESSANVEIPEKADVKILKQGLQTLIRLLRRNQNLTEVELANKARVSVDEIRKIEADDSYIPSPRTVYQLEEYFKLEPRSLVLMSGAVKKHSAQFTEHVLGFAAHSKNIAGLTKEEKKLLNEFVRYLSKELKKRDV